MPDPGHALMSRALGTTQYDTCILGTPASIKGDSTRPTFNGTKRKRSSTLSQPPKTWDSDFTIRQHPIAVYDRPHAVVPLLLLPRIHLPLAFLDLDGSSKLAGRLFNGTINAFDASLCPFGHPASPLVLIAKLVGSKSLYAIEKVEQQVHAVCKLGAWVKLEGLKEKALAMADKLRVSPETYEDCSSHQDCPVDSELSAHDLNGPTFKERERHKQRRIERTQSIQMLMSKKPNPVELPTPPSSDQVEPLEAPSVHPGVIEPLMEIPNDQTCPDLSSPTLELSPEAAADSLLTQYLDSLYLNEVSLAYFAKGPLSRARAAFKAGENDAQYETSLIDMLQNLSLPIPMLEKKFNATLPAVMAGFPPDGFSDDEEPAPDQSNKTTVAKPSMRNRRKGCALKPRKDGTYPSEPHYLQQWWNRRDNDVNCAPPIETREQRTKRRLFQLKKRETKLQVILILEILSLQASSASSNALASVVAEASISTAKKQRPKKKLDVGLLLDLHVDRLAIWQSLGPDGSLTHLIDSPEKNYALDIESSATKATGNNADGLHSFCAEVVIPFFSAKLPETISQITKSLGGPKIPRPKMQSRTTTQERRGKAAADGQREPPQKPRQTLERTLTDGNIDTPIHANRSKRHGLKRSSTVPNFSTIKREEIGDSIFAAVPSSKGNIQKSKSFSRREVDFSAVNGKEPKSKRSSTNSTALQEAISALKKPNRGLAVKEIADSRDLRLLGKGKITKIPLKPPTLSFGNRSVQVLATPRGPRKINALQPKSMNLVATPSRGRKPMARTVTCTEGLVLSVPASSPPIGIETTPDRLAVNSCIETPRRDGPRSPFRPLLLTTPTRSRPMSAGNIFSPRPPVGGHVRSVSTHEIASWTVEQTPLRKTTVPLSPQLERDKETNGKGRDDSGDEARPTSNQSIYDVLGWNEVDEF
ncbi:MAG: hypothetical protein M1814_004073 [Vezdaea aestivalis]|nr:MAG: hypothetical protein M1814_004073 [Vezdaea aestivalis]